MNKTPKEKLRAKIVRQIRQAERLKLARAKFMLRKAAREPTPPKKTVIAIESRARRAAKREGYSMRKSRAALSINNHGQFTLIDGHNNIVAGEKFDMSAADVLEFVTGN